VVPLVGVTPGVVPVAGVGVVPGVPAVELQAAIRRSRPRKTKNEREIRLINIFITSGS